MITIEQWKEIEEKLKFLHIPVKLKCDGYEVTILLQRISPMKNALAIYINGYMKGEWLSKDCEERRRFIRSAQKSLLTAKDRKGFKKLSKKFVREMEERAKYTAYYTHWGSFRSLKKHLIEHNENIELISIE